MYMTVADLQRKLNNLLKEMQQIDKASIIVDCDVVKPEYHSDIPNGSIVFKCVSSKENDGTWHELQLYPDPPSRMMS